MSGGLMLDVIIKNLFMQRLPADLFCTSHAQMQQRRYRNHTSQLVTLPDHPPHQKSLLPSLRMRQTPNLLGPQKIRGGGD